MIRLVGIDGHDGAGKTTLATLLAARLGGECLRPFRDPFGAALMTAAEAGDVAGTVEVGRAALERSITSATRDPAVLDRSWITVATLVPWDEFHRRWEIWIPTVLCWADLDTTLARVSAKAETPQPSDWHESYLRIYAQIAAKTDTPVLRTDLGKDLEETADELMHLMPAVIG